MNVESLKGVLLVALFFLTFLSSLAPFVLRRAAVDSHHGVNSRHRYMTFFSLLSCFGGGVFLATCLLDLFPEAVEKINTARSAISGTTDDSFPLSQFLIAIGFLLILTSEQIGLAWKEAKAKTETPLDNKLESSGTRRSAGEESTTVTEGQSLLTQSIPVVVGSDMRARSHSCHIPENPLMPLYSASPLQNNSSIGAVRGRAITTESRNRMQYQALSSTAVTEVATSAQPDSPPPDIIVSNTNHMISGETDDASVLQQSVSQNGIECEGTDSMNEIHFTPEVHSTTRAVLLVLALSLHSAFEGLALGLQDKAGDVFTLFGALCIHKSIVSFSLGLRLVQSRLKERAVVLCCIVFSSMTVIGAVCGIVLTELMQSNTGTLVNGIFQSMACGTFIYVTFFEILPHELNPHGRRLLKLGVLLSGFSLVSVLIYFLPS